MGEDEVRQDFTGFVQARYESLLRTSFLLTGNHEQAEDLLQAALVKTWRHWRRIERTDRPEVFVRRVLVNQQRSWWRARRVVEDVTAVVPEQPGPATAGIEEREELWRELQRLPARQRAVIVLRYWEDLSEQETADVLGCSLGTVKSQASRGLQRLRRDFGLPPRRLLVPPADAAVQRAQVRAQLPGDAKEGSPC